VVDLAARLVVNAGSVALVLVGVVAVIAIGALVSYNRFVHQRNLVSNSWHNIDTELQRRYDLVPNLVETVRGYAAHEQRVFTQVTAARATAVAATGPADAQEGPERALVGELRGLLAVAERYPDLQASDHFLALQRELADTEDRIQVARRIYNANVRALNTRVESFPSNLVARGFGFGRAAFFQVDPAVAVPPVVRMD
jgi:LemA protein